MKKDAILTGFVFLILAALFAFAANDWKLPWTKDRPKSVPNPALARGGTHVVQFAKPKKGQCINTCKRILLAKGAAERAGLKLVRVEPVRIDERRTANAETAYLPHRYARVAPRIGGVVVEPKVVIGKEVEKGDPLAVLDSPEFGQAKADYLQALSMLDLRQKTHDSEAKLFPKITTARQMLEAKTRLEEAKLAVQRSRQRLANLGLTPGGIERVAKTRDASPRMELAAPFSGTVVDARAVPGDNAGPGKPLFAVADLGRMWLSIDVYEEDLFRIEKGQAVFFRVEGLPGESFPGKVAAIAGEVDDRARTVKVYAEIKNRRRLLRANMFGRAEILIRPPEKKLLLLKDAVQNDGDCNLVFVSTAPDIFVPRKIKIGAKYRNGYEVEQGLAAGETVVTTGSFLLKTELLRGQIGAG